MDASLALAWCFEDEDSPEADSVIARLGRDRAVVPSHWPLEVANGLLVAERRGRLTRLKADELRTLIASLPVTVEPPTPLGNLGIEARIAREHTLSMYDAAYVALAARRSISLHTLDAALLRAAKRFGVTSKGNG